MMDRELSRKEKNKRNFKIVSIIFSIIVIFILFFLIVKNVLTGKVDRDRIIISEVIRGDLEDTFRSSGRVIPEFEQVITSPINSTIEIVYFEAGDKVKKGQSILKLNQLFTQIEYDKQKDEYELKKNRKSQLKLSAQRNLINYSSELSKIKLENDKIEEEIENNKHLLKIGGVSKSDFMDLKRELEKLQIDIQCIEAQIENINKVLEADLKELDLQINIQKNKVHQLSKQMELAQAIVEDDGIITWINDDIGANVNAGEELVRIADMNSFKIEAEVAVIYSGRLKLNQRAIIIINQEKLTGQVSNIQPTMENNTVNFTITPDNKQSNLFRSNMKVDVFVITSSRKNVLKIENGPQINGSGKLDLFVMKGNKAYKRSIIIGVTTFDFVEVCEGLDEGEKVIISDMSNYQKRDYVIIK